jgi:hypothetical protein
MFGKDSSLEWWRIHSASVCGPSPVQGVKELCGRKDYLLIDFAARTKRQSISNCRSAVIKFLVVAS